MLEPAQAKVADGPGARASGRVRAADDVAAAGDGEAFRVVGHETADRLAVPSTASTDHALGPPVGSVDTSRLPPLADATHRVVDGQDTLKMFCTPGIWVLVHVLEPPIGFADTYTDALPSTPTHSAVDGQDIP